MKYFPELIHMFSAGLDVYKSAFLGSDGLDGVVAGNNPEFTKAVKKTKLATVQSEKIATIVDLLDKTVSLQYFSRKATAKVKFLEKKWYEKILVAKDVILYSGQFCPPKNLGETPAFVKLL